MALFHAVAPIPATKSCSSTPRITIGRSRRNVLLAATTGLLTLSSRRSECHAEPDKYQQVENLIREAQLQWSSGLDPSNSARGANLAQACDIFDTIVAMEPQKNEWLEARGQVRVDAKRFQDAIADFGEVIKRDPANYRAYSGRALAFEGLAEWKSAVADYSMALKLGRDATGYRDPYILNSRGNALASLGMYKEALRDYSRSFEVFLDARQTDGAIYAGSNAALMRIQIGDEANGMRELMSVARRAPGSIDMRAALAAVYWSKGRVKEAEEEWQFACEEINSGQRFDGCRQYKDRKWLQTIRRWPPVMVQLMDDFLYGKAQ